MTLQLLLSEFPYIWGKFYFLFYQCGIEKKYYKKRKFHSPSSRNAIINTSPHHISRFRERSAILLTFVDSRRQAVVEIQREKEELVNKYAVVVSAYPLHTYGTSFLDGAWSRKLIHRNFKQRWKWYIVRPWWVYGSRMVKGIFNLAAILLFQWNPPSGLLIRWLAVACNLRLPHAKGSKG